MKRKILALLLLFCLFLPTLSFAAGTAVLGTVERYKDKDGKYNRTVIPITFTADAADASVPSYTLNPVTHNIKGWYLYKVRVNPGSTGPTNAAWDLDITNASGYILSKNKLDDQSSTATNEATIINIIDEVWTISVADNAVNSASVVVKLIFTAD